MWGSLRLAPIIPFTRPGNGTVKLYSPTSLTRATTFCDVIAQVCKMATLSKWEKTHLEHVQFLLKQAEIAIKDIGKKEETGVPGHDWQNWLNFRDIVYNLYSVLDYTYYFLCCHFSHEGGPAPHQYTIHYGFPYKTRGVRWSQTSAQDTGKKTFVEEKAK